MSETNDFDQPILQLSPQEKAAFSYLFNLADTDSLGVITGERAISFFEKTHVPAPALGEIWQIADTENRGLLTKPGFCMVVRLIGWYQNGQPTPTTELAFKPAPLAKFDGITLPSPPQQQQQTAASPTSGGFPQNALQPQLSGQSTGGAPIRVPPLDPAKVQQYSGLFERSGAQNGQLDGGTAKSIFERAGLPNEMLGRIWMLSDRQQRGALDETEFIVAMHLLTSMKTRAMTALPTTLPPGLYEAAARRGQRPVSRQMSGQAGVPTPVSRQFTGSSTQPRTQSPLARAPGYSTPPPQSAQPAGMPWLITAQEKSSYDRFFSDIDKSGRGAISGEQAVEFFQNSNLPEDTLASIWDLADINSEGQLNKDEFAVAMYLIRQQRGQSAAPLPAFLPPALIPPSMRRQQQPPPANSAFQPQSAVQAPKSASEDLFGLDSSPTQSQPQQPSLQPQGTGASTSRDPFGGSGPSSPSTPNRFAQQQHQQPTGGSSFKQFVPTSAFGASLASQHTGTSTTSSQGQARGFQAPQQAPRAPMPSTMDDLLGDNEDNTAESSRLNNDTTELANMSNQIGNLRNQMESTQNKKVATQADLTASANQKRDLEQRLQQFRTQYESEVKSVKDMEQQLATSRDSTKKLGQELAMLEGTRQDLQTQHSTISQQLQADQQENATLKQKMSQMNAEVARLKPEIEKMKLDARQQKGLVSINKKQLATNEAERDRLQSEKADLERAAAEQARSAAASPEPAFASQSRDVVSPAGSTMSSTNPFFKKPSGEGSMATSPAAVGSSGPTPSAFDALFGPSAAFAPTGQAQSRTGTPPATSFIGRSMPMAAPAGVGAAAVGATAVGGAAFAESMSSRDETTPLATPSVEESAKESPLDTPVSAAAAPPPPPESRQFTPTNLPLGGGIVGSEGKAGSDTASSTRVIPPASRAGGVETPREFASSPPGSVSGAFSPPPQETEREIVPGAFPDDEAQPSTVTQEVPASTGPATPADKLNDDFDSAFAGFGEGDKAKEATSSDDPFAPSSSQDASQPKGFSNEFPPIQNLDEEDDSSDSDDDEPTQSGFDDNFSSPPRNGTSSSNLEPPTSAAIASGDQIAAARPELRSVESTASDLPPINKETSPPTYEQSDDPTHGGSGDRTGSNQFPPEFNNLLPSREVPTSPPPPTSSPPPQVSESSTVEEVSEEPSALSFAEPERQDSTGLRPNSYLRDSVTTPGTDIFVDAFSRPMSSVTETAPDVQQSQPGPTSGPSRNVFDEFDDFDDLSEAKEADKDGSNFDFGFGRPSVDEFNPAFDSPAPSQSQTPTPMNRSVQQPTESNGFANFAPNVSTSGASPFDSRGGSIQQTPQNVQHDWDAIFSGIDSSKDVDTSLNTNDPWGAPSSSATTNGNSTAKENSSPIYAPPPGPPPGKAELPQLGRAVTPGTEHDDPILKRLTGMGYPRTDALNALERFDYDINKAVDHLSGN